MKVNEPAYRQGRPVGVAVVGANLAKRFHEHI
jgi:hypothetical protein